MFNLSPAEEQQLVEEFYRQRVAAAASDEEELRIVEDLLDKSRMGFIVGDDGQGMYLQKLGIPTQADFLVLDQRQEPGRRLPLPSLLLFLALAAFALFPLLKKEEVPVPKSTRVAALAVVTQTARLSSPKSLTPTAGPTLTETPSPTPTSTPTSTPTLTPTPLPPEEVEVKPEPVKLEPGAVVPVSLEIAGRYFPVVPTTLRDEAWAYQPDPNQVSWLAGSAVNVVLGLPYTAANLDLVTSLALSDTATLSDTLVANNTLILRTSTGGVFAYRLVERRRVGVYQIEVLDQRRAGLTLALLGGDEEASDQRLVLWAVPAPAQPDREEVETDQTPGH